MSLNLQSNLVSALLLMHLQSGIHSLRMFVYPFACPVSSWCTPPSVPGLWYCPSLIVLSHLRVCFWVEIKCYKSLIRIRIQMMHKSEFAFAAHSRSLSCPIIILFAQHTSQVPICNLLWLRPNLSGWYNWVMSEWLLVYRRDCTLVTGDHITLLLFTVWAVEIWKSPVDKFSSKAICG